MSRSESRYPGRFLRHSLPGDSTQEAIMYHVQSLPKDIIGQVLILSNGRAIVIDEVTGEEITGHSFLSSRDNTTYSFSYFNILDNGAFIVSSNEAEKVFSSFIEFKGADDE